MPAFKLDSAFVPTADQPRAIEQLAEGIEAGERFETLLGATGTGKTMTMAGVIEAVQRPALVIAHNKTLAAQLCNEFRTFFPDNAVEYFVSYYDYYQPEAYVPSKDLYIEKDSAINQEVDRLRHAATAAVFARRDVIVVASVSCIFGLGSPETYEMNMQILRRGDVIDRDKLLRKLVSIQYTRNDTALGRGTFRVRGETLEIFPAYAETAFRATLFGDEIERLQHFDPLTGELIADDIEHVAIWPATHYNVKEGTIESAVAEIGRELNERCTTLEAEGKLLESHRLRQRTQYDMEMLREMGFCSGIENYSRILDGRRPGDRPYCLIDYFPEDFVCFVDESHQTVPQIGGMFEGDRSRKQTLVDYGFRLPSALDNRPQTFEEFLSITPQLVMVSATPGDYERTRSGRVVEQIVRPTGIVDPEVEVRATRNQIDDLMNECRQRVDRNERVARDHPDQEDVRGPDRLPAGDGLQGALPALGDRHAGAHPDHPRPAPGRVRRAGGSQPAARGAGPARGLIGGDPRRRQGGLPARRDIADPDHRPRRAQHRGPGADVRRQGDPGDARGDRGDRPPPRDPARLQRGARDHRGDDRQGHLRHRRVPHPGLQGAPRSQPPAARAPRREEMPQHELERLVVELEEEMLAAADDLRFEYAAQLRDELRELRRDLQTARISEAPAGA